MSAPDEDVIDYAAKVEEAVEREGNIMSGGAWAKEYARGVAPVAWALVGLAEELSAGTTEMAEALKDIAGSVDSMDLGHALGGAIERGLDSAGQEIGQSIERGLSEIARALADR